MQCRSRYVQLERQIGEPPAILLRLLVDEVIATVEGETEWIRVTIRWAGGHESRHCMDHGLPQRSLRRHPRRSARASLRHIELDGHSYRLKESRERAPNASIGRLLGRAATFEKTKARAS